MAAAVVARSDQHIAFLDHEPLTLGHTLVCPVRKVSSIFELSDGECSDLLRFAETVQKVIKTVLKPIGVSQIMNEGALNELDHLHLHLVPRYADDNFEWVAPGCRRHSVSELELIAKRLRSEQISAQDP